MGIIIIMIVFGIISFAVSSRLKSKFKKYSQIPLNKNLSGAEIAQLMLADNGIHDVKVTSVEGQLTDHYNPVNKTVNLSEAVYYGRNAAAAAVAAAGAAAAAAAAAPRDGVPAAVGAARGTTAAGLAAGCCRKITAGSFGSTYACVSVGQVRQPSQ